MFDVFARRSVNYSKNSEKANGNEAPCVLCGKPVKNVRYEVHLHRGGSHVVTEKEALNLDLAEDMGMYPLGSECYRSCPEIRPYVYDNQAQPLRLSNEQWKILYMDLYRQTHGEGASSVEIKQDILLRLPLLDPSIADWL